MEMLPSPPPGEIRVVLSSCCRRWVIAVALLFCLGLIGPGRAVSRAWAQEPAAGNETSTEGAVAAVPEGLPTLATTTLALAIQDLRRRRIIIRRLSAVEGLAGIEIACFDKTGTLTLNDMSVVRLYWNQTRACLIDEQFRTEQGAVADRTTDRELVRLLELAILCNDVELVDAAAGHANGSATEGALVRAAIRAGLDVAGIRVRHPRRATLERAEDRRFMVTVHDAAEDRKVVIVKGDPGEVLALCRRHLHNGVVAPLEVEDRRIIEAENLAMAEDALRVLGIAYRSAEADDRGTRIEQNFICPPGPCDTSRYWSW